MADDAKITEHLEVNFDDVERVSTRPQKRIELCEPKPQWAASFQLIADKIRRALGDRALVIEHVGSTSIPGLPAKDIIDVDLTVADIKAEETYVPDLEAAGFQFIFREPKWYDHRFFGLGEPYANLHVFGPGAPEVIRHKIFKEYLLEHEDERRLYAKAKREAASATGSGTTVEYNAHKEPVLREILDRAFKARGFLTDG